ncbi:MAG: TolC family protein, partial [Candidatus Thiodiazotropha sp.]
MTFSRHLSIVLYMLAISAANAVEREAPETGQPGPLSSLVETAWMHNPDISALVEEVDAGKARIAQTRAQLLPNATLNGNYAANHTWAATGNTPDGRYRYSSLQTSVRVPLFKPQVNQTLESSQLEMLDLKLAVRQSQNALALSIIDNVLQHIVLREEIHVLEAQISNLKAQVDINLRRLEGGLGSRTEVGETRLRLRLAQTRLATRRSELNRLRIELTRQLGIDQFKLEAMTIKPEPTEIAPDDVHAATERLLKENLTLQRASNKVAIALSNRRLQDRGHWPTLNLVASRVNNRYYGSYQTTAGDAASNSLTLEFELPLYAGGGISARQNEASALWLKAQQELLSSRKSTIAELQQQFEARSLHLQRIVNNEATLSQARELLEITRKAFAAGNRSNIDVL